MGPVLLTMLPFVLGAIAPTMIGLVVIFLTGTRGPGSTQFLRGG